jgi:hypothetical protein
VRLFFSAALLALHAKERQRVHIAVLIELGSMDGDIP